MAIVTNILSADGSTTNLRDALMAATGWWERMDPEQRKAYIKKHPRSKYARDHRSQMPDTSPGKNNGPSGVSKTQMPSPARVQEIFENLRPKDRDRAEWMAKKASGYLASILKGGPETQINYARTYLAERLEKYPDAYDDDSDELSDDFEKWARSKGLIDENLQYRRQAKEKKRRKEWDSIGNKSKDLKPSSWD